MSSNVDISKNTVAIILAAGESKRLGEPKALLNCGNKTLIKFIVERLKSVNLQVIVVTNMKLVKLITDSLDQTTTIVVPNDVSNRTGNLLAGLAVCKTPQRILVVPVDRPGWSIGTLIQLLSMNETSCPEFEGKGGHPLLICGKDLDELSNSPVDMPLNSIFKIKRMVVNDSYLHLNIDTPSDKISLEKFIKEAETNSG
jgi:molybdenum cofactor cytidylyltransferase